MGNSNYTIENIKSNWAGAHAFSAAVKSAKQSSPHGNCLRARNADEYRGAQLFGIFDDQRQIVAGGAVLDCLIISVFRNYITATQSGITGVLSSLMPQLIAAGGDRLVCQGPLVPIYGKHGFVPVARANPIDPKSPEKFYLMHMPNKKKKPQTVHTFYNYDDAFKYLMGF